MSKKISSENLIVPVYINEKIVLDMLAILEDGFSMVSQVNYSEHEDSNFAQKANASVSTSATLLSKLLKIDITGELDHASNKGETESVTKEKVHTNVSLLSKFRDYLVNNKLLKVNCAAGKTEIGDFIEIEGELQKNPLIDYMEHLLDLFRMSEIFTEKAELGQKTQTKNKTQQNNNTKNQISSFVDELKHSGTIDFILSGGSETVILSAQEKYLANDNISEIIGGRFRILGKVIQVFKDENEGINLLRKTSLSIFTDERITDMFSGFKDIGMEQFNMPDLKTKISGPALIVIPIAIYS